MGVMKIGRWGEKSETSQRRISQPRVTPRRDHSRSQLSQASSQPFSSTGRVMVVIESKIEQCGGIKKSAFSNQAAFES